VGGAQHGDGWQCLNGIYLKAYNNLFVNISNYAIYWENLGQFTHGRVMNNISVITEANNTQAFALGGGVRGDGVLHVATDIVMANNLAVGYGLPFTFWDSRTPSGQPSNNPAAFIDCYQYNNVAVGARANTTIIDVNITGNGIIKLGNTAAARCFVSYTPDSTSNDYHLTSAATELIGVGFDLTSLYASVGGGIVTDLDGIARPNGTAWEIGAYEYAAGDPVVKRIKRIGRRLKLHAYT
jgi:hypothetical protein